MGRSEVSSRGRSPSWSGRLVNIGFALTAVYVLIALLLMIGRVIGLTDMKGDTFIALSMTVGAGLLLYMIGTIIVHEYLYERNRPKRPTDGTAADRLMLPLTKMGRFIRRGGIGQVIKLIKQQFPSVYFGTSRGLAMFIAFTVIDLVAGDLAIAPWQVGLVFGVLVGFGHYWGRYYERTGRV